MKKSRIILLIYFLLLVGYSFFTYAITAPNLTLIKIPFFVKFQNLMWQTFYHNRNTTTLIFCVLFLMLFGIYLLLAKNINFKSQKKLKLNLILVLLALPLLFAYNALSLDVFNYIFNAKMVVKYQANPHIQTALNFAFDPWMRFMHNIHTPAPYGYGWTALSLLPFSLGLGKFSLTWLVFKIFSLVSLMLLIYLCKWLAKLYKKVDFNEKYAWLVCLNPLVLIELIGNAHNDLWMMLPAFVSLGLISFLKNKKLFSKILCIILSIALLAFSISTKFASLLLLPIWLGLFLEATNKSFFKSILNIAKIPLIWWQQNWTLLASILMFLPLLTNRSQQFHPWYLVWSLAWLPLIRNKLWKNLLLVFSFSSLLRYLPWILNNDYTPTIQAQQKIITWAIPVVWLGCYFLKNTIGGKNTIGKKTQT